jgi:transposase-like protein
LIYDQNIHTRSLVCKYFDVNVEAVAIFLDDGLIKTKSSIELRFHHLFNTTNLIERFIREIRRRTNAIGHFENLIGADKNLFSRICYTNIDLLDNASFNDFNFYTHFGT